MWELDCEESWVPKNWCFWTMVLEKTLESPLNCKEIQPVHPKGDQSWVFIGKTDAKAETPILWPPHVKCWLIGKDIMLGGIGGRRRRGRRRMRWLDGITDSMDMSLMNSGSWLWTGRPGVLGFMGLQRVGHDWATELNWSHVSLSNNNNKITPHYWEQQIVEGARVEEENPIKRIFGLGKNIKLIRLLAVEA